VDRSNGTEDDEMIEEQGARLFLEPDPATLLEDKIEE
jgi:hypothetical protein